MVLTIMALNKLRQQNFTKRSRKNQEIWQRGLASSNKRISVWKKKELVREVVARQELRRGQLGCLRK